MLRLELRTDCPRHLPIELDGFTPDAFAMASPDEVANHPIWQGNRQVPAGSCFAISGDASDQIWHVSGGPNIHRLGEGMTNGTLVVRGSVGHFTGCRMRGGSIRVEGAVGDALGQGMRGGRIEVLGDAGDAVGGPLPGQTRGMAGGEIIIHGNAGANVGKQLRRGTIVVVGDVGPMLAEGMIAGTCVVGGTCGLDVASGLKRGTLVLLGDLPPASPTFTDAGRFIAPSNAPFLQLLQGYLRELGVPLLDHLGHNLQLHRARGDLTTLGQGEIFSVNRWV